jgi:UDP-N-acetylmuramoylalanine--D-glutamate ligase
MNSSKPVLILGKGITGESFRQYFLKKKQPYITFDTRVKEDTFKLKKNLDFNFIVEEEIDFNNLKFIACSPGFDLNHNIIKTAKEKNVEIKSDINIFLEENTSKKILISGTNGKSTVCSWLEKLFNYKNLDTLTIGNIGKPVLEFIKEKKDFFVVEVSSFHLDIARLPYFKLSVLLNITPDHIDRHGSFNDYAKIKKKISDSSEISIVNENLKEFIPHADYFFSNKGSVKDQNFNAIKEICSSLNLDFSEKDILNCFVQLPHRMEPFHKLDGNITFIDDSKATNEASSLEGLKSIDESKSLIVICGGRSKNQDLKNFTHYLNKRAKKIYYFGESVKILKKLLDSSKSQEVLSLEEAVQSALKIIESDTVLILSPACSSLDMFESFQERGKKFKDLVLNAKI